MLRHIGWAVCEGSGHVIPLESHYSSKSYAESLVYSRVMDAWGMEATEWHLFPASQEEAVREMVEAAVADSCGYTLCQTLVLAPREREERRFPDVSRMDAARAIEELADEGYPARWSKGGNLWALAPEGADLRPYGMRYSPKRGMWWCRCPDSGGASPSRCRPCDFAA